ncbi:MAG: HEAT repeat domain-containing protein [Anaerolineae bacterium]|nr:HEAT repeat domain-containing protein [Anaerolineae bacterium]MDW8171787.1 HEAT repeat domain-containing protein [Anaerolineae bacterium]
MPYTKYVEPLTPEEVEARLAQLQALPLDENTLAIALRALDDPEDAVVAWALRTLKALGDPSPVERLLEFIQAEDDELTCLALETLAELGPLEALAGVARLHDDASKPVRDAARQASARLRERFAHLGGDELAARLRRADDALKPHLLQMIAATGERRFASQVAHYVQSDDPLIMKEAVRALARLGDKQAIQQMSKLLRRRGLSDAQRGTIITALGEMGEPNAIPILQEQLKQLPRKLNQRYGNVFLLVTALTRLRAKTTAPMLANLLDRGDEHVQRHVLWGLAELGDNRLAGRVRPLLAKEQVRPYASLALGRWGERVDLADVLRVMRSKTPEVRQTVLETLRRVGPGPVLRLAAHPDPEVRRDWVSAVGRLAWRESPDALLKALAHDPDRSVQRAAHQALARYEGPLSDDKRAQVAQALADWQERHASSSDSAEEAPSRDD